MSQLGIGAMLHSLGGGSPESASDYYGRKIVAATLENDQIFLTFGDGVTIRIWDAGQSCCESRYMRTDDNPSDLAGKTLTEISVKQAPDVEGGYGDVHEVAFLEIQADGETVTFSTHNEHNGYYGGFELSLHKVGGDE